MKIETVFQAKDLQSVLDLFKVSMTKIAPNVLAFRDITTEDREIIIEIIKTRFKESEKNKKVELIPIHITVGSDPNLMPQHIINQVYNHLLNSPYWKDLPFDLRRQLIAAENNGLEHTTIGTEDINRVSTEINKTVGIEKKSASNFNVNFNFVDAAIAKAGAGGETSSSTARTNQTQNNQTWVSENKVTIEREQIPRGQIDMLHRLGYFLNRIKGTPILFYSPFWEKLVNWYSNNPDLTNILPKVREISNSCIVQFLLFPIIFLWELLKLILYPLWLVGEVLLSLTVAVIKILPDRFTFNIKRRMQIILILEGFGEGFAENASAIAQLQYLLCNPSTLFVLFMDGKLARRFK